MRITPGTITYEGIESPPTFADMLVSLHTDKSKAYAGSWCKRGEVFSILPNIVRKTDRLGVEGGGDSEADTYVDLAVYLLKYEVWLERGAAVADDTDHMERAIRNAVGNVQGWTPNAASVASWRHGLVRGVERIINRFDSMTRMGRHAHVSRLVPIAMAAAQAAVEREGWSYP